MTKMPPNRAAFFPKKEEKKALTGPNGDGIIASATVFRHPRCYGPLAQLVRASGS